MRIVLDLQKFQSSNCIDDFSLSFAKAIIRNRGVHEIFISLNALFPETLELIRSEFHGLLSQDHIRVWYTPGPVSWKPCNTWRREVAELIGEAFVASMKPDIVHTFSMFDGFSDNSVTSLGIYDKISLSSVFLPDFFSLLTSDHNLYVKQFYFSKLSYLRSASLYFVLSESSRQEWIKQAELSPENVIVIADVYNEPQIKLWDRNAQLAIKAFERIRTQSIENKDQKHGSLYVQHQKLITAIAELNNSNDKDQAWIAVAKALAKNTRINNSKKQLLVDISELAQRDAKTGIQRVVRSVLKELLQNPPENFSVQPVYATKETSYRYARRYTAALMNLPKSDIVEDFVEVFPGDIFLGLDYQADIIPKWSDFFIDLRHRGIKTIFLVYDLLPYRHREWFCNSSYPAFVNWLQTIAQSDGILCISKATASDFIKWLDTVLPNRRRPLTIGWSHIGADITQNRSTTGLPYHWKRQLDVISSSPFILMVGTIEPRKGHAQTLAAFELLWKQGINVNLVIVGKDGWKVETIKKKLTRHKELDKKLFWLQGINDASLLNLYETATGVLMASEGEGFGLPLIEAAQYGRPILARDLEVFREVAGNYATYFSGNTPEELAHAISSWLEMLKAGNAPDSKGMPWLTWEQCTQQIVGLITNPDHPNWVCNWLP